MPSLLLVAVALLPLADAPAVPPGDNTVEQLHIVRFGPGCMGSKTVNVNLAGALFEPMSVRNGGYFVEAINIGALKNGRRLIFNEADRFANADLTPRFLVQPGEATREILEEKLPVLVGAGDFAFQYPVRGHRDYLKLIEDERVRTGGYADTVRSVGRLVRLTKPGVDPVLALEIDLDAPAGDPPDAGPLDPDVLNYDRPIAVLSAIKPRDDAGTRLFSFSRAAGSPVSVKQRVDDLKASLPAKRTLVMHAGHAIPLHPIDDAELGLCAETLAAEHIDAIVPLESDLGAGPAGLTAFARRAGDLPFVAANLRAADGTRPFPRYRILDADGIRVAVVGVVGSHALDELPSAVRAQWKIDPPALAVNDALEAIYDQLQRWPDITVALSTASQDPDIDLHSYGHIDIAIEAAGGDLIRRTARVDVEDREHRRGQATSLFAPAPGWTVSHITANLAAGAQNERKKLLSLEHQWGPIVDGDAQDLVYKRRLRAFEERQLARDNEVVIPDPEPFIRAHNELAAMTWGERVLDHGTWMRRDKTWAPFVTDPLWMRLVTNAVKRARGDEVVLAVNLKRNSDVLGALSRFIIEDWLQSTDLVLEAELSGSELMQVAARLARQDSDGAGILPREWLFAAGLDAQKMRIAGRAIRPEESYRVAYTESVARLPELAGVFEGKAPLADGKAPALHDVVMAELTASHADAARIFELLLDDSGTITDKTTAGFDELSLSGNAFRNSDNVSTFGPARETRVSNPNLYQLGVHANTFFLYDNPWIASEWRALAYLDGIYLDIPGLNLPPQEQRDDIVLSTELRLNKVKLGFAGDDFQVIPFGQAALDTEFTSTPVPSADPTQPLSYYPHQWLARETVGLVAYPGPRIKEVRLGAIAQHDFSELVDPKPDVHADTGLHNDVGFVVGYKVSVPLFWRLRYDGALDLRYFVPDGDDRPAKASDASATIDLALHMDWTHKLLLPLTPQTAFFLFADVFVVSGKAAFAQEVGWNGIVGAGLQFQQLWKL